MAKKNKKYDRVLTEAEQKERSAIIREGCSRYADRDCENYAHFSGMTAATGRKLINEGFADPEDAQNSCPTFEEIVEFCENHPGFIIHGYTIGDDRRDARVTAEGVEGTAKDLDEMLDFIEAFRYADDLSFSKETLSCHCWYD